MQTHSIAMMLPLHFKVIFYGKSNQKVLNSKILEKSLSGSLNHTNMSNAFSDRGR